MALIKTRKAQRTIALEDRTEANRLNWEVKLAINEVYNKDRLQELNPQDSGLWNLQKKLKIPRKSVPPLHGEKGIVSRSIEKSEAFANFLGI